MTVPAYKRKQRVVVKTVQGEPSFVVHARVRDEFIDEIVQSLFGTREGGKSHEWEAFDVEETEE